MKPSNVLVLPGWQSSGPQHWQTLWERRHGYVRVEQHDWMRPLRAIAARHEVLGVEVLDPRDVELPDVGDVILQDTESGVTREFTIDEQLRDDFARAATAHREEVARTLRRCGAPIMTLRTDRDWIADIVRFVASRRRGALAGSQ